MEKPLERPPATGRLEPAGARCQLVFQKVEEVTNLGRREGEVDGGGEELQEVLSLAPSGFHHATKGSGWKLHQLLLRVPPKNQGPQEISDPGYQSLLESRDSLKSSSIEQMLGLPPA